METDGQCKPSSGKRPGDHVPVREPAGKEGTGPGREEGRKVRIIMCQSVNRREMKEPVPDGKKAGRCG